jgi:hypothetical protein
VTAGGGGDGRPILFAGAFAQSRNAMITGAWSTRVHLVAKALDEALGPIPVARRQHLTPPNTPLR